LRGLRKELISRGSINSVETIGTACEDTADVTADRHAHHDSCDPYFVDDVSGMILDTQRVKAARKEEIEGVNKHNVYTKVPIQECWDKTGQAPVSTKWVDINKGDIENPDIRCRWVGREFKGNDTGREDLFAATPPLEAKKALLHMAANQIGIPKKRFRKLGFIDIKKAYFHAKAKRLVYVDLPDEALEPGEKGKVCGRLNYSLYGTRDAANNWEDTYTEVMVELGFEQGKSSPCIFLNKGRNMATVVHGDDFTTLATEQDQKWFAEQLKKKFGIKERGIMGMIFPAQNPILPLLLCTCPPSCWLHPWFHIVSNLICRKPYLFHQVPKPHRANQHKQAFSLLHESMPF
jgi:hypothetical protein